MPLWRPYDKLLKSSIADVNHIAEGGFAGSVVAALFLRRFAARAKRFAHLDIFGWVQRDRAIFVGNPDDLVPDRLCRRPRSPRRGCSVTSRAVPKGASRRPPGRSSPTSSASWVNDQRGVARSAPPRVSR